MSFNLSSKRPQQNATFDNDNESFTQKQKKIHQSQNIVNSNSYRLETDPHLSLHRKLKNFSPNSSKDFSTVFVAPLKTIAQTQLKENIDSKFSNLNLKTNRSSKNKNSCKLLCENSFHPLDTEKIEKATLEKKLKDKKKSVFIPDYDTFFKKDGINGINDLCLTKNIISTSKTPMFAYKLYKTISKFYIVEKFIKNLRNATNIRIPTSHQLNRMHILNDLSFFKEGFDLKNTETINKYMCVRLKIFILINGIFSFFIKCLLKFYHLFIMICCRFIIVFDPASTLRAIWDVLHLFVLCFYFFKIPVELSFEINIFEEIGKIHHNFSKILECFGTLFLLIDILVNFNTGYYKKGCLIYSQKNIAKHYIKSKFFFDIISFIPILLEYQKFSFDEKWMFLFVFRVSNFFKIFSRIEESIHINFKLFNLLSLLKVLARIVLLSHLFACGWHYISLTNISHSSETWLIAYKLANEIWWKRYISSYYFVCVSMNTVGYGDFVPQNEIERVFCIFFIYVACGIFAYTLNIVGQIIQQISKNKSLFLHNMMTINEYMNKRNINFDLRTKIRKYLEYVWMEEQSQNSEDENLIINKLSISLKEDLFLQTNGNIIKEIPFFMNNFSEKTLKKLAFTLKELHYMPGDIIFQKGDNLDQSFYILWKGEVELYMDLFQKKQTNQSIEKIKMGNSFGEKEFITGCERAISARSTSFSTVFILKYSDFMDILLESPEDFIKFKEIKDKIDLYNNYVDMPIICDHCKEANHSITECPLLHLIILRKRIIQKFCYQKPNERISMHKRKGQKYNARRKMQVYQFVAKTIQKENFFDEDVSENHENSENSSSARILEEMQKNKNEVVNASESEDLEESSENYFYDAEKFNLNQNEKKDIICSNNSNFQIELPGIIEKNKITSLVSDSYKYLYIKKPSEEAIKSSNDMTIKKKIIVNNSEIKNSNSIAKIHTSNSNEISKYAVINEDEKKKNFDLFKIFERKMDYENYFPLGNSENIIKLYNKFSENIFNLSPMSRKMKKYPTRKRIYDQNFSKLLTPNNLNSSKKLIPSFSKSFFFNKDEVRKNKDKIPSMLDRQSMIKLLKRTKKREKKSFFARIIVFVKKMLEEN